MSETKFVSENFVFYLKKVEKEDQKLLIRVPKKVGAAVKRNKIKRWIREAFRALIPKPKPGIQLLVLVREKQNLKHLNDVKSEFSNFLEKCLKNEFSN